ncbi:MAG TPA: hypothetical protein DDY43_10795 [Synechococcales bacterium UBA10510]|nr:hypothetical protein [Synechococcales bacterium UBA10510]
MQQLLGRFYMAVLMRLTALRLRQGCCSMRPVALTTKLSAILAALEQLHGPVVTILLPTS